MIPRRWINILPAEANLIENPPEALLKNDFIISRWETEFSQYFNRKYAVALPSGRIGFNLILKFFISNKDLKPGDEVLVPALTLKAIVEIVKSNDLIPVFVDIDPRTLNISLTDLKKKITNKTKMLLALHAFGNPCSIDKIYDISKNNNLILIEDCAHACGAELKIKVDSNEKKRFVGTYGEASFFSFDINKVINTYGGGIVLTDDSKMHRFIRDAISNLGKDPKIIRKKLISLKLEQYLYKSPLIYPLLFLRTFKPVMKIFELTYRRLQSVPPENIKFNPIQASIGIEKLPSLYSKVHQRLELAKVYRKNLTDKIKTPYIHPEFTPSYYMFVVILPCYARKIARKLLRYGIDSAFESEIIDLVIPPYEYKNCPNAVEIYPKLLGLPFYDSLEEEKIEEVCRVLETLLRKFPSPPE
ncbi:MAG: aminotransferase class I/II-fold pyridoxal phosphate-dependent enzyme [Candidatus Hydrogenedentes bacterium]|nr:aminotransferase class I/II-fold pyridoxal phosphate-dependent enzyme [Candidatus Hydrogenedentota bacterium]